MEEFEGDEWVLISDESPVDEHRRDELIERFQVTYHPGGEHSIEGERGRRGGRAGSDDQEVGRRGSGRAVRTRARSSRQGGRNYEGSAGLRGMRCMG